MTEATKRPWKRDKYGYMTADGENLYVAHGVTVPNGESHPRYAEALANEELIFKAVNSHDALVAALEQAEAALGVILLDENIKAWLAVNDPMAQQQAQRAFAALAQVK